MEGQKRKEDIVKAGCLSKETGNQACKHNVKGSFTSAEIYLSHVEGESAKKVHSLVRSKSKSKEGCLPEETDHQARERKPSY